MRNITTSHVVTRVKSCMTIFTIIILFSGSIAPSLLIQESDAAISKGTMLTEVNSNKVCGLQLCSDDTPIPSIPTKNVIETTPGELSSDLELLFVQLSQSGTFTQKDGQHILTLYDISTATLYFSDRPYRVTGTLNTDGFVSLWHEGGDSFANDPPNAVLELVGSNEQSDIFILELMNPVYNYESETLQYNVKVLSEASKGLAHYNDQNDINIPATFGDSVLFIDGIGDVWNKIKHGVVHGVEHEKKSLINLGSPIIKPIAKGSIELGCKAGKDLGSQLGGAKGAKLGCAVGTQLGLNVVKSDLGMLTGQDIDSMDVDFGNLPEDIKTILTSSTSNAAQALALTYNVFNEQEANIKDIFLSFMHGFRDNPKMTAAYDADNFCGTTNDNYFENILYPFFLYNLDHELYFTILDNLNDGMSLSQVQSEIEKNLEDQVRLVIIYSLVHIRDSCIDEDSDLYSLIYDSINPIYKLNLIASSNSEGDTTMDGASLGTSKSAITVLSELVIESGGLGSPSASSLAKESSDILARADAYAKLDEELASYGIDDFPVDDGELYPPVEGDIIPVSSDPIIVNHVDTTSLDMGDVISTEVSSEIDSLIENPENYMDDFKLKLDSFNAQNELLLDDILDEMFIEMMDDLLEEEAMELGEEVIP